MNEILSLSAPSAAGALLGVIFFGGLWWTVRKGASSEQPALWFFGSLMLRTGITLAGFYYVGEKNWERWLLCLLGFVAARLFVVWLARSSGDNQGRPEREVRYAP